MCKQKKDNKIKKINGRTVGSFFLFKVKGSFLFTLGDEGLDEAVLSGDLPIRILLLALLRLPLLQSDHHVRLHRPQAHQGRRRPETHQRLKKNMNVVSAWFENDGVF